MKILFIGLGSIAKKHITAINKLLPSPTIYALRSSIKSNTVEGVTNISSLKDVDKIDFAIISTPTFLHKESIQQALSLNCPLFIEKPLYHTLDIINEIEHVNVLNYCACNLRFLDSLIFLKNKIKSGTPNIQEINVYCGSYLPEWRPGCDYRKIYSSDVNMGGGVHLDLIHELDYIYWLCGMPLKTNSIFKNNSKLGISACDYANYCLEYNSFCVNIILNYYRRDPKRSMEIVFEDCTWEIDLLKNIIYCNGEIIFESKQRIIDTYESQLFYFIGLVKNRNRASNNSVKDAYNVLKICLNQ